VSTKGTTFVTQMRKETDMTPQEQDEKRVEKIVAELTKTLGHTDTESAPYKLIKSAIVKAYQLGHTDGYADYFYDEENKKEIAKVKAKLIAEIKAKGKEGTSDIERYIEFPKDALIYDDNDLLCQIAYFADNDQLLVFGLDEDNNETCNVDFENLPQDVQEKIIVTILGHQLNDGINDKIKDFGHFMCLDATEKAYYYLGGVVTFHDYAIPNAKHEEPMWDEDRYYADFDAMWENNLTDEQRINILKYVYDLKSDKDVEEFITTQMGGSTQR